LVIVEIVFINYLLEEVEFAPVDDGIRTQALTTVLLSDQSGLDENWDDTDIILQAVLAVLAAKPDSPVSVLANGNTKLTAFIPTDRAFRKLVKDLTGKLPKSEKATFDVLASLGIDKLETVLLYHVYLGDPIEASQALQASGTTLTSAQGKSITLQVRKDGSLALRDANKKLKNPKVIASMVDINKGNQQIAHVIDRVLIPVSNKKILG
jgi:uncharacterized surface protein with fasciclin (FAS1) repeats